MNLSVILESYIMIPMLSSLTYTKGWPPVGFTMTWAINPYTGDHPPNTFTALYNEEVPAVLGVLHEGMEDLNSFNLHNSPLLPLQGTYIDSSYAND